MKRRHLLYITDCEEKRFDNHFFNGRLPFTPKSLPVFPDESERGKRRADYSVADGFALRVMLDFTDAGGVDVEAALYAAGNAWHKIKGRADDAPSGDVYLVLVQERPTDAVEAPRQLFAVTLAEIPAIIADKTAPEETLRVVLVNASAASRFVMERAREFGTVAENDFRPAWDLAEVY